MAVVALLAATAIAGCGSDSSDDQAVAPAPVATAPAATSPGDAPAATTATSVSDSPETSWANKLCTQLAGKAKPITPPNVQATTPEDTQKSLVTFFTSVVDQLGSQIETIESVGPPPGAKPTQEWEKAVASLRDIRKEVAKVTRGVKRANPTNAAELQKVIGNLGEQMKSLSTYEGPVKDLAQNKTLSPALEAEPACQKVS